MRTLTALLILACPAQQGQVREFVYKKTPQGELKLFVHLPADAKKGETRPALVFFFGGGWTQGSVSQFTPQAEHFAARGMVAVRADYRVESRHKTTPLDCVEDAKSAVRWMRKNAVELGIDPGRIVGSGGSAGGHLAACTGLTETGDSKDEELSISSKTNLLVLFNPVFDLTRIRVEKMPGPDKEAQAKSISPIFFLKKDSPATIEFFGTKDALLAQGREFLAKSKETGNSVDLYTAEGQGHGFFNKSPWAEATLQQADAFLVAQGYLKGESGLKVSADAALRKQ
jgi:acetyl esterase